VGSVEQVRVKGWSPGRPPRSPLPEQGYLSLNQAARWAGVSTRTLKRWIAKGLPKYQAGIREKVLIRPADIERFLARSQAKQLDLDAIVEEVLTGLQGQC
jgi:excisionase family DNA binding protein